jgi:hypothetical protein
MTRTTIVMAAALALAVLPAVSAQAQAPRTFVSAAGSDSNPCSFAAPCRHFQAAANATSAGGEVDALDPAGYGPIIISQAVSIEGQGWSYIAPPPGGNGITINAVSGNVSIHGVSLNGAGITGITNGIVFNSGVSLTITDCVVQNFTFAGIYILPSSGAVGFVITNTNLSNDGAGLLYDVVNGSTATANGVIDHVVATNNQSGIVITTNFGGGSTAVAISNSIASESLNSGISITGPSALAVAIDNSNISNNFIGISGSGDHPRIVLGRSAIMSNSLQSILNQTGGTIYTYQNNQINLNGNSNQVGGAALIALPFQ